MTGESPPTAPGGSAGPAGVVLAAGAGVRLLPLTATRPKALCPVGGVPLLDLALDRLAALTGTGTAALAVNAHHFAAQIRAHVAGRATVSVEQPEALGTAGALALLRGWIDGRDVAVTNADSYLPGGLAEFAAGWDRRRPRLLCARVTAPDGGRGPALRADFTRDDGAALRYVGACLLPWPAVAALEVTASGLYEVMWREQAARGGLDLVTLEEVGAGPVALDCGTPAEYLRANLHACAGRSAIGAGAQVLGRVERCVVWDGARVEPWEHLVDAVRAGDAAHPVTVDARG